MENEVRLLNMFPDYQPPESLQEVLAQAALVAADIDPEKKMVVAAIHSETYIPKRCKFLAH